MRTGKQLTLYKAKIARVPVTGEVFLVSNSGTMQRLKIIDTAPKYYKVLSKSGFTFRLFRKSPSYELFPTFFLAKHALLFNLEKTVERQKFQYELAKSELKLANDLNEEDLT